MKFVGRKIEKGAIDLKESVWINDWITVGLVNDYTFE